MEDCGTEKMNPTPWMFTYDRAIEFGWWYLNTFGDWPFQSWPWGPNYALAIAPRRMEYEG